MRTFVTALILGTAMAAVGSADALAAGLPQLDTSTFAPQLVWLVISFAVLYYLMSKVALPRIGEVLEDRQARIDDNLKKAEALKADAEAAAAAYEKSLSEARSKAHDTIKQVRDKAAAEAQEKQDKLADKLAADVQGAEVKIVEAKNKALGDIQGLAVEVAENATEKLLGQGLDAKVITKAVEETIKERA